MWRETELHLKDWKHIYYHNIILNKFLNSINNNRHCDRITSSQELRTNSNTVIYTLTILSASAWYNKLWSVHSLKSDIIICKMLNIQTEVNLRLPSLEEITELCRKWRKRLKMDKINYCPFNCCTVFHVLIITCFEIFTNLQNNHPASMHFSWDRLGMVLFKYTISYPRLTKLLLFTSGWLFPWCMFINNKLKNIILWSYLHSHLSHYFNCK